jgi:tight adherence protein C
MISVAVAAAVVGAAVRVHWVAPRRPSHRARTEQSAFRWRPSAALLVVVLLVFAALGLAAPALGLALSMATFQRARTHLLAPRRHRRERVEAFPLALDVLVAAVHGGALPIQAIGEVRPYLPPSLQPAFAVAGQLLTSGARFGEALDALDRELGSMALPLTDALRTADEYGLPLAPVLDRLAAEARAQRRRLAEAHARELPVRLSVPLVTCTLTSFVLLTVVPLLLGALSSVR